MMNLDKYLVISGVPGVHTLVASRSNGLIIDDKNEGRTRFVPVRQNQVTPLATIGIYTETEEGTASLATVFQKMHDVYSDTPPVDAKASGDEHRAYFLSILPEHDQYQVHISDIKKCIKWYNFMREKGMLDEAIAAAAETQETPEVSEKAVEPDPEPKPKKTAKSKSKAD
jgi:hypothetical protein